MVNLSKVSFLFLALVAASSIHAKDRCVHVPRTIQCVSFLAVDGSAITWRVKFADGAIYSRGQLVGQYSCKGNHRFYGSMRTPDFESITLIGQVNSLAGHLRGFAVDEPDHNYVFRFDGQPCSSSTN